jgi:[ribosomal protein S5]-alanine N-acetyltransferase
VFRLEPLALQHEKAVFAFERDNRTYFTRSINDRGDSFFQQFSERYRDLIAEQEAGTAAFYVLVDDRSSVVGRFNLYDLSDGTARVGYRVAEQVSGQGVATSGLRELCRLARVDIGLQELTAVTDTDNVASQRVLAKAGFELSGPTEVVGRKGSEFRLSLL